MKKLFITLILVLFIITCFANEKIENGLELALKKAIDNKTEENVHLMFDKLNKWGFINYFEFSNPYLKNNSLISMHIALEFALKGDDVAIQTVLNSVNILIQDPNNVEYSEWFNEDINRIIRKHFVLTATLIVKMEKNYQVKIAEMLKDPVHDGFDYNDLLKMSKNHDVDKRLLELIKKD